MPTGYTNEIKDGISFAAFAMNCARAFGACVTLRDEQSGGDKIPEKFEPSQYHANAIAAANDGLRELDEMTAEQAEKEAESAFIEAETARSKRLDEIRQLKAAYEAMSAKALAWIPPTAEHQGLKKFMLEQIAYSIEFDCDETFYQSERPKLTGVEWVAQRRALLERDVEYHTRNHAEEVKRASERTAWIAALRASLSADLFQTAQTEGGGE